MEFILNYLIVLKKNTRTWITRKRRKNEWGRRRKCYWRKQDWQEVKEKKEIITDRIVDD